MGESTDPMPSVKICETMGDNKILQVLVDKVMVNVPGHIPFRIGPKLQINNEKEKFIANTQTGEQLPHKPRKGFVVRENV